MSVKNGPQELDPALFKNGNFQRDTRPSMVSSARSRLEGGERRKVSVVAHALGRRDHPRGNVVLVDGHGDVGFRCGVVGDVAPDGEQAGRM